MLELCFGRHEEVNDQISIDPSVLSVEAGVARDLGELDYSIVDAAELKASGLRERILSLPVRYFLLTYPQMIVL